MRSMLAGSVVSVLIALAGPAVAQTTVAISCGAVGREYEDCREGAEAWEKETGNKVELIVTPSSSTDRLAFYRQRLSARPTDIDVLQIDVVWAGVLADDLLDLSGSVDGGGSAADLRAAGGGAAVGRPLFAVPWTNSVGQLYYRRDLLAAHGRRVPETWEELTETARIVMQGERNKGHHWVWGYIFQGHAYEGLTVNALEWLDSRKAGGVVEPDGRVSVNNPSAAEALALAASWIGTISPPSVLNYTEEEARRAFQSGQTVFMRNWPYACPLIMSEEGPAKGNFGIALLPKGGPDGKATGALGGEQLAVSRHSDPTRRREAIKLVRYLVGREERRLREAGGGADDPCRTGETLRPDLAPSRPTGITGVRYGQVSAAFWNTVHVVLSGKGDARSELGRLERTLDRIVSVDRRIRRE